MKRAYCPRCKQTTDHREGDKVLQCTVCLATGKTIQQRALSPTTDDVQIAEAPRAFTAELLKLAAIAESQAMEFEGGRDVAQNLRDMAQSLYSPSNPETVEDQALMSSFGGRLGALVVEYSEGLSIEEKAQVLSNLDESTDAAYAEAGRDLASILKAFSEGR